MRTRFFPEGSPLCPIVAITEFEASEISALAANIRRMQAAGAEPVVIDGEVLLRLETSKRDVGISELVGNQATCALRNSTWENVVGLLEPFMAPGQSEHQWLDESGSVRLLISRNGEW